MTHHVPVTQFAPIVHNVRSYRHNILVLYDFGFMACFDTADGAPIFKRQRIPNGRAFTSSPWAYGGLVFCLNEDGVTNVIKVGEDLEILHANELAEDDMAMATPAIVGQRLLIRPAARIYCIEKGATSDREE